MSEKTQKKESNSDFALLPEISFFGLMFVFHYSHRCTLVHILPLFDFFFFLRNIRVYIYI